MVIWWHLRGIIALFANLKSEYLMEWFYLVMVSRVIQDYIEMGIYLHCMDYWANIFDTVVYAIY